MTVLKTPVYGVMEANCYFYVDDDTGHCLIIDPGAEGGRLLTVADQNGWTIEKILLTHGHFDHIGGIGEIRQRADVPVYIHEAGQRYLADPRLNLSRACPPLLTVTGARSFADGQVFDLAGRPVLRAIHTPGHTPDSVIFYDQANGLALTGDTIFKAGWGNTAFPGGDAEELMRSIKERVLTLPDDTKLYSGHSDMTTVGAEKRWYR